MLKAPRGIWTNPPTSCSRKVRRGLLICHDCQSPHGRLSRVTPCALAKDAGSSHPVPSGASSCRIIMPISTQADFRFSHAVSLYVGALKPCEDVKPAISQEFVPTFLLVGFSLENT